VLAFSATWWQSKSFLEQSEVKASLTCVGTVDSPLTFFCPAKTEVIVDKYLLFGEKKLSFKGNQDYQVQQFSYLTHLFLLFVFRTSYHLSICPDCHFCGSS